MIGAILSFSSMAIAGRAASVELDTFETDDLALRRGPDAGAGHRRDRRNAGADHGGAGFRLHFARNLAHFTGQNLWFYAITVSPLALVFALEFTSPLWVMVLAAIFLGERLTRVKLLAGALGFAGVLLVVQPGAAPLSSGMVTAAMAAITFATTAIFTKKLTATETITCILFYLTSMQLVMGLAACLYDGDMAIPTIATLPWVVLIAIAGLTAHFCLTTALSIAPASIVMPMDFARLPAIAVIGMVFYDEPLAWGVALGALLIFAGNYINILGARAPHPRRR
jgi:drug/metabolite transporter (DMT)-like permease